MSNPDPSRGQDSDGTQDEPYEAPAIEVIEIAPEEALLAICKLGSAGGPIGACVACAVSGS